MSFLTLELISEGNVVMFVCFYGIQDVFRIVLKIVSLVVLGDPGEVWFRCSAKRGSSPEEEANRVPCR